MSVISTMSPKLRAAVGAVVLLMCWLAGTCTRQTPGAPSSNQNQPSQSAENTPPKPATAPTAAEETPAQAAAPAQQAAKDRETSVPVRPETAASTEAAAEKPAPSPKPPLVLAAGSTLTVRTNSEISAKSSQQGAGFEAVVAQPVKSQGRIAIPAGATVTGAVVQAKQGGKIKGSSNLALQLTTLHLRSASYSLHTNQFVLQQKGKGERTAKIGAGSAAGGAIIGGIAGGGKGAAIGSIVGGGAGVAGSAMTGNKELRIPAESVLSFKLTQPLRINGVPQPGQYQ